MDMATEMDVEMAQELDLEGILEEGNESYPFNNIATVCRLTGETGIPKVFGGDCYEQVVRMIRRVREAGARALHIVSGVHFAAFLPDTNGGTYLDPTLNMRQPIALPSLRSDTAYRAETYPVVNGVSSFIEATLSDGVLESDWHKAMMAQWGQPVVRKFPPHNEFDLGRATETFHYSPEMARRFFREFVLKVHWNALDMNTGEVITVTVDPNSVSLRGSAQSGRVLKGAADYDAFMERVAATAKATRQEIDEFLALGQAKFRELKGLS